MLQTQLTGFKELGQQLQTFAADVAEKELRSATMAATKVVRLQVLANAERQFYVDQDMNRKEGNTGTLRRAIYNKYVKSASDGRWNATYAIGVRMGKRWRLKKGAKGAAGTNRDAYYWWWLEFGTSKMAAKPFVRPALPAKQAQAIEAMRDQLRKGIKKRVQQMVNTKFTHIN